MNLKIASVKMMKAYEDYFHVILYTTSTRQVLIFNSWKETLVIDHSNETRAVKLHLHVVHTVLSIMLFKMVLTFHLRVNSYCVTIQIKAI